MGAEPERGAELYCATCEQAFASGDRCPTDNTRLVRIAAAKDSLLGRELDGRYTIVEKIGQGGMGAVYRGTQHSVGREVAIKVVTPSLVADGIAIKRFLREAKLASRLSHPNAVAVLDFGQTDDGLFYLVMELVIGKTLDVVLKAGTLSPQRLVRIGTQICDALEGAHALPIVHRDLKPQNVMVLSTGRDLIKVLDFGLAKSLMPDLSTATMTNAGALLGTPAYMPPELIGGRPCDARADLYSLGCILFVAATGKLPFESDSVHELIAMHACEPIPAIRGVPPRLAAVIGRLLEKEPDDRFQTATAVRDALEATLVEIPAGWTGSDVHRTRIGTPVSGVPRTQTPPGGVRASTPAASVRQTLPLAPTRSTTPSITPPRASRPVAHYASSPAIEPVASMPANPPHYASSPAIAPSYPSAPANAPSYPPANALHHASSAIAPHLATTPSLELPPRRSHRGLLSLGAVAVIAVAAVVAFLLVRRSPAAAEPPPAAATEPSKPATTHEPAPPVPAPTPEPPPVETKPEPGPVEAKPAPVAAPAPTAVTEPPKQPSKPVKVKPAPPVEAEPPRKPVVVNPGGGVM